MPVWPATLPQAPLLGHTEAAPDLVLRTGMDAGPAKVRRRFTAGVREIAFPMLLDEAQVTALDEFYVTALAGGALRFDHALPRTGAVVQYRFIAPPEYELIAPMRWRATLKLEVLP